MRKEQKNVSLKSFLRQPVRALLLLAFIAVLSFACVSRTAEYLVVSQETERLGGYYRAIGELERVDSEDYNRVEGADYIAKSEYVEFEDRRRHVSAVLQDVYNADVDTHAASYEDVFLNEIVVYAELVYSPVHSDDVVEHPLSGKNLRGIIK